MFYVLMHYNGHLAFSRFFGDKVWLFLVKTGWEPCYG